MWRLKMPGTEKYIHAVEPEEIPYTILSAFPTIANIGMEFDFDNRVEKPEVVLENCSMKVDFIYFGLNGISINTV